MRRCAMWEKPDVFMVKFTTGSFLIQRGAKFDVFHPNFGPSSFMREFLENGIWMQETQGKKEVRNLGGLNASRTPCTGQR